MADETLPAHARPTVIPGGDGQAQQTQLADLPTVVSAPIPHVPPDEALPDTLVQDGGERPPASLGTTRARQHRRRAVAWFAALIVLALVVDQLRDRLAQPEAPGPTIPASTRSYAETAAAVARLQAEGAGADLSALPDAPVAQRLREIARHLAAPERQLDALIAAGDALAAERDLALRDAGVAAYGHELASYWRAQAPSRDALRRARAAADSGEWRAALEACRRIDAASVFGDARQALERRARRELAAAACDQVVAAYGQGGAELAEAISALPRLTADERAALGRRLAEARRTADRARALDRIEARLAAAPLAAVLASLTALPPSPRVQALIARTRSALALSRAEALFAGGHAAKAAAQLQGHPEHAPIARRYADIAATLEAARRSWRDGRTEQLAKQVARLDALLGPDRDIHRRWLAELARPPVSALLVRARRAAGAKDWIAAAALAARVAEVAPETQGLAELRTLLLRELQLAFHRLRHDWTAAGGRPDEAVARALREQAAAIASLAPRHPTLGPLARTIARASGQQ